MTIMVVKTMRQRRGINVYFVLFVNFVNAEFSSRSFESKNGLQFGLIQNKFAFSCFVSCANNRKCKGLISNAQEQSCELFIREFATPLPDSNLWIRDCPDGYVNGVYSLQCYRVITTLNSWEAQQSLCEADNGYLTELVDHAERIAVYNYLMGIYQDDTWVGVVQQDPNAQGKFRDFKWYWSDTAIPSNVEYWANRYLPSTDFPVSCGGLYGGENNNKLHDNDCNYDYAAICEW